MPLLTPSNRSAVRGRNAPEQVTAFKWNKWPNSVEYAEMLRKRVDANPIDWECADWDTYYAEFSQLMTLFLPIAHRIQVPHAMLT